MKGGIKNPPGADSGILDYCNERAWYARKYRYRERTESSKARGGRMKKCDIYVFRKNKNCVGLVETIKTMDIFKKVKKVEIFGFH